MLAIVVAHPAWPGPRRCLFPLPSVTIGRASNNELALTGPGIDDRHAALASFDGTTVAVRVISRRSPTYRGTWRVPQGIDVRDTVSIGRASRATALSA